MAKKALDDHASGHGTRMEMNFLGVKRSGYLRPKEGETASRLANSPAPTAVHQLRGVMKLTSLPPKSELDVNKGIRFRIKQPNPNHVTVSLLRSAYLLVFSLLGRKGYRYAESEALRPIREQIMKPDETLVPSLIGKISGLETLEKLITLNFGCQPFCWIVTINDNGVVLPCGGSTQRFWQKTQRPIQMEVTHDLAGHWVPRQFRNEAVVESSVRGRINLVDGDLIGRRIEGPTSGGIWEWVIVDHQAQEIVALPLRPQGLREDKYTGSALMILGEDEIRGRGEDRSNYTVVSPNMWPRRSQKNRHGEPRKDD